MARTIVRGAVIAILIVGLRIAGDRVSALSEATGEVNIRLAAVPPNLGNWRGRDVEVEQGLLDVLQPIAMLNRTYERESDGAKAHATAVFATEWRTIHSPHRCLVAGGWRLTDTRTEVTVHGELGEAVPAKVYIAEKAGARLVGLHAFVTRRRVSTNYLAQVARIAFSRGLADRVACLVTVSVEVGGRPEEEAIAEAGDLFVRLVPHLREALVAAAAEDANASPRVTSRGQ